MKKTQVKGRTCLFSEDILPDFIMVFFGRLIRKVLQLPETPRGAEGTLHSFIRLSKRTHPLFCCTLASMGNKYFACEETKAELRGPYSGIGP